MLSMWEMTLADVVFTHQDTEGVVRHFAVSRIVERYRDEQIVAVPINHQFARHVVQYNGLEEHRYNRITNEVILSSPVIYATLRLRPGEDEPFHILIDGSHRYAWAAAHRWTEIPAIILAPEQWEPFLIDVPEDITELAMRDIRNGTAKSYLP